MTFRMHFRMLVCLLGMWIALLPAIGAVPSFTAVPMTMSPSDGIGGCDPCPDGSMDSQTCAFVCLSVTPFVAPSGATGLLSWVREEHPRAADAFPPGYLPPPDPAPPKISSL
jgi:hypothetical protein